MRLHPFFLYKQEKIGDTAIEVMIMVKGISRQVIVLNAPDPRLFEQAIFIIKEGALGDNGVTDEALMKEARRLISTGAQKTKSKALLLGSVWACGGALLTGIAWLLTAVL